MKNTILQKSPPHVVSDKRLFFRLPQSPATSYITECIAFVSQSPWRNVNCHQKSNSQTQHCLHKQVTAAGADTGMEGGVEENIRRESLCSFILSTADIEADRTGASLTGSPVNLHFHRSQWQTKMHSESEAYMEPIKTLYSIAITFVQSTLPS